MLSNTVVTAAMLLIAELPKHSKEKAWDVVDDQTSTYHSLSAQGQMPGPKLCTIGHPGQQVTMSLLFGALNPYKNSSCSCDTRPLWVFSKKNWWAFVSGRWWCHISENCIIREGLHSLFIGTYYPWCLSTKVDNYACAGGALATYAPW